MKRPTLRHRLEYLVFRVTVAPSQEFQLNGVNDSGSINWVAGMYVSTETVDELAAALRETLGCPLIGLNKAPGPTLPRG